jgi:hypothetical protein
MEIRVSAVVKVIVVRGKAPRKPREGYLKI